MVFCLVHNAFLPQTCSAQGSCFPHLCWSYHGPRWRTSWVPKAHFLPLGSRDCSPRDLLLNSTEIQKSIPSEQVQISKQRLPLCPNTSSRTVAPHPNPFLVSKQLLKSTVAEGRRNGAHGSRFLRKPPWEGQRLLSQPSSCVSAFLPLSPQNLLTVISVPSLFICSWWQHSINIIIPLYFSVIL